MFRVPLPEILWCWVSFARAFLLGRLLTNKLDPPEEDTCDLTCAQKKKSHTTKNPGGGEQNKIIPRSPAHTRSHPARKQEAAFKIGGGVGGLRGGEPAGNPPMSFLFFSPAGRGYPRPPSALSWRPSVNHRRFVCAIEQQNALVGFAPAYAARVNWRLYRGRGHGRGRLHRRRQRLAWSAWSRALTTPTLVLVCSMIGVDDPRKELRLAEVRGEMQLFSAVF